METAYTSPIVPQLIHYRKGRQARRVSQNKKRPHKNTTSYAWLWLCTGAFVGILGAVSAYLLLTGQWSVDPFKSIAQKRIKTKTSGMANTEQSQKPKANKDVSQKTAPPRFEFYQLLPGMEVPIPETHPELATTPIPPALPPLPKTTTPPLPPAVSALPAEQPTEQKSAVQGKQKFASIETKIASAQYLLQAGAYKTAAHAEALKSRLRQLGFSPRIQKVEAEDGAWFRVMLGPFPSETMALKQKNNLAKQKINGVLILQRR